MIRPPDEPQGSAPGSAPETAAKPPVVPGSDVPADDPPVSEPAPSEPPVAESEKPAAGVARRRVEGDRAQGVGRRKTAVARAVIKPGTGKIGVNDRDLKEYFRRGKLVDEINQPFTATGTVNRFDTTVAVFGSSLSSQAGAVRLAISRALAAWQPDLRSALASEGLLTRDPRMVERKKYGIRGARRRPQWTKR